MQWQSYYVHAAYNTSKHPLKQMCLSSKYCATHLRPPFPMSSSTVDVTTTPKLHFFSSSCLAGMDSKRVAGQVPLKAFAGGMASAFGHNVRWNAFGRPSFVWSFMFRCTLVRCTKQPQQRKAADHGRLEAKSLTGNFLEGIGWGQVQREWLHNRPRSAFSRATFWISNHATLGRSNLTLLPLTTFSSIAKVSQKISRSKKLANVTSIRVLPLKTCQVCQIVDILSSSPGRLVSANLTNEMPACHVVDSTVRPGSSEVWHCL